MRKFAEFVVKRYKLLLALALLACIPVAYGFVNVTTHFDIYRYAPSELESVQGMELLKQRGAPTATAQLLIKSENAVNENVLKFVQKASSAIKGVKGVVWVSAVTDYMLTPDNQLIPFENLPPATRAILAHMFFDRDMKLTWLNILAPGEAVEDIRKVKNDIKDELPSGAEMYLTGTVVLDHDLMELVEVDRSRIDLIAFGSIGVILLLLFLSAFVPIALALTIGLAIFWNIGLSYWWPGSLNFIAFAAIVTVQLGASVDYGIYLTTRYKEERKRRTKREGMVAALSSVSRAVVGCSATTIAGFGALGIARFGIISELGLIIARGIFLSFIAAMVVLPGLLLASDPLLQKLSYRSFRA